MKRIILSLMCVLAMVFAFGSYANADLSDGLVAYYPFDGDATDSSGNGHDGTVYGSAPSIEDRFGNLYDAYLLDGSNDYVNLSANAGLYPSTFTISAWVKPFVFGTGTNIGSVIFSNYASLDGFIFHVTSLGEVAIRIHSGVSGGGRQLKSLNTVPLKTYSHVVATYDGTDLKVFIDGVLDNVLSVSITYSALATVMNPRIGKPSWANNNLALFKGCLDDIRLYNRALSETEVGDLYDQENTPPAVDNLVANYLFENSANDSSVYGYDGVMYGLVPTEDRLDNLTGAYAFDGINDYVDLPRNSALYPAQFTLNAWIKPEAFGTSTNIGSVIFSNYAAYGSYDGLIFCLTNTGQPEIRITNGQIYQVIRLTGINSIPLSSYSLLTASYDGESLKLYIDGVLDNQVAVSGYFSPYAWSGNPRIGRPSWTNNYLSMFEGSLDEFQVYNRALSEEEVEGIYNLKNIQPPSNVMTIAENGKAIIQWDPVEGANKYHVYMGYGSGVTKTNYNAKLTATNLNTNLFVWKALNNNEDYYFIVTAVTESQGVEIESKISSEVSVTPIDELFDVQILDVPFQSQLEASCYPNYLCGYAATNMMTAFLHGVSPSVIVMQDMAEYATTYRCPPSESGFEASLLPAQNIGIGNAPDSYYDNTLTFDEIKALLRNNKPVHVGITYSELGQYRCDTSWDGGHAVVIVGYSESQDLWYIHDPLCPSGTTGAYKEIPSNIFRSAVLDFCYGIEEIFTIVIQ